MVAGFLQSGLQQTCVDDNPFDSGVDAVLDSASIILFRRELMQT